MTAPGHLPTTDEIRRWAACTISHPLRVLVSACLLGVPCGVDGTSYGAPFDHTDALVRQPRVRVVPHCPEQAAFGTPRATPDIHGGNGFDVLDGTARVRSDAGEDWTAPMVEAAYNMLALAQQHAVHFALLTDISAACGSQVIYDGPRALGRHQAGQGVCAALLIRHGFRVVSQRDQRTLGLIVRALDPTAPVEADARDHHQTFWYRTHLS
jgi:uncharacterized protein YbbK (DUF523 family)